MRIILTVFAHFLLILIAGCGDQPAGEKLPPIQDIVELGLERARQQSVLMAMSLEDIEGVLPRSTDKDGKLVTSDSRWWCSGFFPGLLWYVYENTRDNEVRKYAEMYTLRVEREKYTTNNHDVGFMLYCSFGNGLRLTGNKAYEEVRVTGTNSLITRYNPKIGLIKSWESNTKWQYPVIVDNMMNLELIMWTAKHTGDTLYSHIAKSHADRTMTEHYRPDYSSYHVVSYDTITSEVEKKQTHQGISDESAWARGQAWGLYGYVMMYRETKEQRYLDFAVNIANFLIHHPNMPEDLVPYWDFNAPDIPDEPRDASTAALMASALLELSRYVPADLSSGYYDFAVSQIRSLSSPQYLAEPGTNANFILKHSTGSKPHNSEVDVPLTYADYYYVEALMRLKEMLK
jgi:unsaturated chondroitin disaccharide hydrolase